MQRGNLFLPLSSDLGFSVLCGGQMSGQEAVIRVVLPLKHP